MQFLQRVRLRPKQAGSRAGVLYDSAPLKVPRSLSGRHTEAQDPPERSAHLGSQEGQVSHMALAFSSAGHSTLSIRLLTVRHPRSVSARRLVNMQ